MKDTEQIPLIIMAGPSLSVKGGISSVEKVIINNNNNKINYVFLPTTRDNNKLMKVFDGVKSWFKFSYMSLRKKIDLLHIHFSSRGSTFRKIPLSIMAKFRGIPIILHAHGSEFRIFHDEECSKFRKKRVRNFLNRASTLIVLSESWKNYYKTICDLPDEKIILMRNSVDVLNVKVNLEMKDKNEIMMTSNGRIGRRKGSFDLLKSFELLPLELREKSSFIATGDGEIELWNEYVNKYNLSTFAKTSGWLNDEEFIDLRKKCSIFLLPSYDEGLPMALLEAMAYGQVPIVTPVGGIPEVIVNMKNGLLVEPGDIQGLADAMSLLITDHSLRKELSLSARETVLTLDIRKYMDSLMAVYASVLQNHKALR